MSSRFQSSLHRFLLPASLGLLHLLLAGAAGGADGFALVSLPVLDISRLEYRPVAASELLPAERQPVTPAEMPYATLVKEGPVYAAPGSLVEYRLTVANYESVTRTVALTDTLPAGLAFVATEPPLLYDADARTVTWQGEVAPGDLDYLITEAAMPLPYIDLAGFGVANLCDAFIAAGRPCADGTVIFNLGASGYRAVLYGQPHSRLEVSTDGYLLGEGQLPAVLPTGNQLLPDPESPNLLLAGLWRDVEMTTAGRWHAAVLRGLIEGHDVFYVQWHDAPHVLHPDQTARHAIALVLESDDGAETPLSAPAFYIYDNIADPAGTVAAGYTIGIEDRLGLRGATHAYSASGQPPIGTPPAAHTTLHLQPALFSGENDYQHTFRYTALVTAPAPENVINTVHAVTDSPDPTLQELWATHYLLVRRLSYLPLLRLEEQP